MTIKAKSGRIFAIVESKGVQGVYNVIDNCGYVVMSTVDNHFTQDIVNFLDKL